MRLREDESGWLESRMDRTEFWDEAGLGGNYKEEIFGQSYDNEAIDERRTSCEATGGIDDGIREGSVANH